MRNLWKVLVLFHFVVPFQFMLAGSVTGGNTGDPAMAEVEGARSFLLDLIPKFESHPWFDRLDLNISRYISQRKIPLVNALNAHDIDWVNESSVCIRSRPGAEFILESQVKSCFKLPRRFIIERILTELFLFDGLTSNTALDYSSKIASRAELHQKWLARNVYTTSIETGFLPTLKVLFSEGSELSLKATNSFDRHLDWQPSDRALFVDKHRAALTTALSSLTLKWNEDSSQISCAQVTSEYVVIKPSLCEGILTSEGAAELLIHEAFHVIGFENELDAIRNARMIMLGWQMRPTVSR